MPGAIPPEVMGALLAALPLDITFVDADDIIRYYSDYRIFRRTPGILGTRVQLCHQPASRPQVDSIIAALRSGQQDALEQLAEKDGRPVRIRYAAVRDGAGRYLGLVETGAWVGEAPRAAAGPDY